jgi:hypothetical protein
MKVVGSVFYGHISNQSTEKPRFERGFGWWMWPLGHLLFDRSSVGGNFLKWRACIMPSCVAGGPLMTTVGH